MIDAEELMMAMLRITTIDGKIPLDTVIDIIQTAPTVPLPDTMAHAGWLGKVKWDD